MVTIRIVVDAEAKIQTVNPATCQLLGYGEEEIFGQLALFLHKTGSKFSVSRKKQNLLVHKILFAIADSHTKLKTGGLLNFDSTRKNLIIRTLASM